MGKPSGKKKGKNSDASPKHRISSEKNQQTIDEDITLFIKMSQEHKEEGNKLFQRRDHEGAMLQYEKALTLLPKPHIDRAYLHSNIAACFMQRTPAEYQKAINQCNLALDVSSKYSKALLKRARCFKALNRLDLALRDVNTVLSSEPNNLTALEIAETVKIELEKKGIKIDDVGFLSEDSSSQFDPQSPELMFNLQRNTSKAIRQKSRKSKSRSSKNKAEDKVVVDEHVKGEQPMKSVKLVFGEDIRWAQLPANCKIRELREVVRNRFPGPKAVLIKYKDLEGDLVTITTTEELRWAEDSVNSQGSLRLYIAEVSPENDPLFDVLDGEDASENGFSKQGWETEPSSCIDNWIVEFARLFKNHVGFNSDAYLDLHKLGMKIYSEAMEDVVTTEEAQGLFDVASAKFQEMAALALFNWGNVHMSRARKRVPLRADDSKETVLEVAKDAYEWAQKEYAKAGERYEEALKIKPDFYEGFLALGQQQFEQAKLTWYYALGCKVDLETWPASEVFQLFNDAEDSIEKGAQMWEELEEHRLSELTKLNKEKTQFEKMGFDRLIKEISTDEAAEQAANMRSQINLLWGTMLYERSVVEFKLGMPVWEECLVSAIEKFKLAGATPTDIAVMIKNHCSNTDILEGLGFKIDEIVQAWNEMYDARRWLNDVNSFRLEPLFRRRVPKLHHMLEHL